jgi:hypothetical protein
MTTQEHHNVKCLMTNKQKAALGLMIESVLKPDNRLRSCAHNQECYNELMDWRQKMLDLLQNYETDGTPTQST